MKDLDGEKVSVGDLFSGRNFFRVPEYQRPFSWDEDNFEDIIDDLINADKDEQYFLGTVVLHKINDDIVYDIVDGQQRATSLIILFACLRDLIEAEDIQNDIQEKIVQEASRLNKISRKERIEVRDIEVFNQHILTPGGTKLEFGADKNKEPHWRYKTAIDIFHHSLSPLSQKELEDFVFFVNQNCIIIRLSTSSFDDAFRLFSIVNDRGKKLRRIDILKAQNLSPEFIASDSQRRTIARTWQETEEDLGADTFEEVFFLIRLITVKEKPQGDLLKEFERRIFRARPPLIHRGITFFEEVKKYTDFYKRIFVDKDILDIDGIENAEYRSLIFIMQTEFQASEWKACILYYCIKFGNTNLLEFIYQLEKIYLEQWFGGVRKDERYAQYTDILKSIEKTEDTHDVISSLKYSEENIIQGVTNVNLYNAGYKKYVLLRLELLKSELERPQYIEAKSIEHVLPQNPAEDSNWLKSHDKEDMQNYVNSIGNLVLISKSKNSTASNRDFEEKKSTYLTQRVSDYPRSNQVCSESEWTQETIKRWTDEAADIFLRNLQ
ncbi:DUF262 domain-containing HNH endonuclease family protein [Roseibium sp. SCPC15]|uniref:DUF262 domain-containing protein n=1 Tax=Roseibium sp. SCP15 TaxID=3141376 RepID=UPI003339019F